VRAGRIGFGFNYTLYEASQWPIAPRSDDIMTQP
jgi:hypothetical protein